MAPATASTSGSKYTISGDEADPTAPMNITMLDELFSNEMASISQNDSPTLEHALPSPSSDLPYNSTPSIEPRPSTTLQASPNPTGISLPALAPRPKSALTKKERLVSATPTLSSFDTGNSSPKEALEPLEPEFRKRKRERNTEAARRYRQRRVDQVDDLQAALTAMTAERDALRAELSGAKAEAKVLREMMRSSSGRSRSESGSGSDSPGKEGEKKRSSSPASIPSEENGS